MPIFEIDTDQGVFEIDADREPTQEEALKAISGQSNAVDPSQQALQEDSRDQYVKEAQRPFLDKAIDVATMTPKAIAGIVKAGYEGVKALPEVNGTKGGLATIGEAARRAGIDLVEGARQAGRYGLDTAVKSIARNPLKGADLLNMTVEGVRGLQSRTPSEPEIDRAMERMQLDKAIADERSKVVFEGAQPEVAEGLAQVGPLLLPGPKGLKAAGSAGAEALSGAKGALAQSLRASAEKNVSQALLQGGGTKQAKAIVERITPEILERPAKDTFALTKSGLAEKSAIAKEAAGDAISNFGKLKGDLSPKQIIDKLEDAKKPYIVDGKVIDEGAIKRIDEIKETFTQFGDSVSKEGLREIRRTFDKQISESKGFFQDINSGTTLKIKKIASDEIRGLLAQAEPDLAKLNKQFNFFANLNDVAEQTLARTKPHKQFMSTMIGAAGAASGGTVVDAAVRGTVFKYLTEAVNGPGWKLTTARVKNSIAKALGDNNPVEVANGLSRVPGFNAAPLRKALPPVIRRATPELPGNLTKKDIQDLMISQQIGEGSLSVKPDIQGRIALEDAFTQGQPASLGRDPGFTPQPGTYGLSPSPIQAAEINRQLLIKRAIEELRNQQMAQQLSSRTPKIYLPRD